MAARVAVIYHGSTRDVHGLACAVEEGAKEAGAGALVRAAA